MRLRKILKEEFRQTYTPSKTLFVRVCTQPLSAQAKLHFQIDRNRNLGGGGGLTTSPRCNDDWGGPHSEIAIGCSLADEGLNNHVSRITWLRFDRHWMLPNLLLMVSYKIAAVVWRFNTQTVIACFSLQWYLHWLSAFLWMVEPMSWQWTNEHMRKVKREIEIQSQSLVSRLILVSILPALVLSWGRHLSSAEDAKIEKQMGQIL